MAEQPARDAPSHRGDRADPPPEAMGGAGDGEAVVRARDVAMQFGSNLLFRDVSFDVRRGEVFVILGLSLIHI